MVKYCIAVITCKHALLSLTLNCMMQVKLYVSQLADVNAEVRDTACLCITELSQKVCVCPCC